ncbi:MAG: hypothetical protein WDO24_27445 [Pseudomonadota bacterium]
MKIRLKWLVTPGGRISSNSGCTEVLVDGGEHGKFSAIAQRIDHAHPS